MCDYVERARNNFLQGYSCAQSVLAAFAEPVGLTEERALMLSSSFGAGIGRLREVCGALSSLLMIQGMLDGYATPNAEDKAAHYERTQALCERFRSRMGSIICRDLLGEGASTVPKPDARTNAYYEARPCLRAVEVAAELAAEIVAEKKV